MNTKVYTQTKLLCAHVLYYKPSGGPLHVLLARACKQKFPVFKMDHIYIANLGLVPSYDRVHHMLLLPKVHTDQW